MIAINTKFFPATNFKGSRIKAYTFSGFQATISYPHEYSLVVCHFQAVKALVEKYQLSWDLTNMRYGESADGRGYTFCFDASKVVA